MDPKASAKSKRTHSQHGRRNHPPPAAIAQKKKLSQAAEEERTRRSRAESLPSNWDRYGGDGEEGVENSMGSKQAEGEIAPKSKGADFGYLMEQARSQPQDFHGRGIESSSFDEFPIDFMQGGSSMLSVRGENLLSWCEDDNFIVDEEPALSYEVPFLSMDLNALAAQLSKLKLSQRLFIEADLLPEEQTIVEPKECQAFEEQSETLKTMEFVDEENSDDHGQIHKKELISDSTPWNHTEKKQDSAEAELDVLLDSYGHFPVSGSPSNGLLSNKQDPFFSRNTINDLLAETSFSLEEQKHTPFPVPSISCPRRFPPLGPEPTNNLGPSHRALDDSIDHLLVETSTSLGDRTQLARSPALVSKAIDDFDSWFDTV